MSDAGLHTLCYTHEIPDPGSKGFTVADKHLFAVKKRGEIHLYVNSCPHVGLPLDWQPDQFLDPDRELIQCANHGALFQIDNGRCVAGPCAGRRLIAVPFELADGRLAVANSVIAQLP